MDRLDVMRLFTRIVERHSFTAAAQDGEIPRSTATHAIKQLEARLGVRLLERTTRHVRPTLDGEAYYRRCLAILGEVEDADAAFSDAKPRGQLKVDVHGTLARHGTPASVDELAGHVAIGFVSSATGMTIPLEFMINGARRNITLPATMTVAGAETYVAAARLGLGLIQVPRYHVESDLAAGTLVELLPSSPPSPTPVSLLYPQNRQLSPRVRVFTDWLTRQFARSTHVAPSITPRT
jgi:DNA-binding transcriptional LysR family regulator